MQRKVVFLDRDGTLITDVHYLNDPDRIEYLPGVFEVLAELRDHGFEFVIVSNQSGVARGIIDIDILDEIHRRILAEFSRRGIEFLDLYYAPYLPESNHWMRKPNPGMLLAAIKKWDIDITRSWMIGDQASDVGAGLNAGCRSILLDMDRRAANTDSDAFVARSLFEVPAIILNETTRAVLSVRQTVSSDRGDD